MTLLRIDLTSVTKSTHPDDAVSMWSPVHRGSAAGAVITTAPTRTTLTAGKADVEVEPGPLMVHIQARGMADHGPKLVTVPDTGPVTLMDLLEHTFIHTPAIESSAVTAVKKALSDALNAVAGAGAAQMGTIPAGTDWNTLLTHGAYARPSGSTTDVNAPNAAIGVLYVSEPRKGLTSDGFQSQFFLGHANTGAWFRARGITGSWNLWVELGRDDSLETYLGSTSRVLPVDTDLNTLTTPQVRSLSSAGRRYVNTPYPDPVGTLLVYDSHNSTKNMQVQVLIGTNPVQMWVRDRNSAGHWRAWQNLGFHDVAHIDPGAGRRDAIVDYGLSKRGRLIGTGGKAAVALRFDHHLAQFGDKVLPLLKKYRLPWGQMINAGNIGKGNDTWAWSKLAQECHISGGEVWNHSWSHSDITFTGAADREVTLGLDDLRAGVPTLWVDGWALPGQANMLGMEGGDTPETLYDTYPGRLVLAQHAFVRGYYPGIYQPLAGPNLIGAPHVTMDAQAATWCEAVIRGAISNQAGLTLMLHPNYLDTAGRMTTADLDRVLGFIAARRDAGELMVLSNTGILMADSARPDTANILSGALGSPGSATGALVETASVREAPLHYGVPHEAVVWVKGAGSAELKVEVTSPTYPVTATHAVTLGAAAQRLSVPVTPPLDTTATKITLTLNGTHTGVKYRPI